MHAESIGSNPRGTRYGIWPFYVEIYIGKQVPNLEYSRTHGRLHNRVIMWRLYDPKKLPKGWYVIERTPDFKVGYGTIPDDVPYYMLWSRRTREYRSTWVKNNLNKTHTIELVPYEVFLPVYKQSIVGKKIGSLLLKEIERRIRAATTPIEFWCVKDISRNIFVAGAAVEYSHTCKSVYYISGFYTDKAEKAPLMIGLFSHLFEHAKSEGMYYMDFGIFWQKGEPKAWLGFSDFKSKFGTQFAENPPVVFRFEAVGVLARVLNLISLLFSPQRWKDFWHVEYPVVHSKLLGPITVYRDKGEWFVQTGEVYQTSSYVKHMWRDAIKRVAKDLIFTEDKVQVLMLGLGTGGALKEFYRALPGCSITAVEYDETMIELTKRFRMYKPYPEPTIIYNDALKYLQQDGSVFNLVVVDLFTDVGASEELTKEEFVRALRQHITIQSLILVNVYKNNSFLELFKKEFTTIETWQYRESTLGLFSISK